MNRKEVIKLYEKHLDSDDYLNLSGTSFSFTKNFLSACSFQELNIIKDHLGEKIEQVFRRKETLG